MHIENLTLLNFKNYSDVSVAFHSKLNCFVGDNGAGKTNILDAIYYLCLCKSYFQSSDKFNIKQGADYMMLQGIFEKNGKHDEIYCGVKTGKRKLFRKNKKEYPKLSDHVGEYPVVMVSPSDSTLIIGGSEERRKYVNAVISQFNHEYLDKIIQYNKIIIQRNKLLKEVRNLKGAEELLEVYNKQLEPLANFIYKERKKFVDKLNPVFKEYYNNISLGKENVEIKYSSQLHDGEYIRLLDDSIRKDLAVQHTTIGIHKDDLEFLMGGVPISKTGSQGQQKTFLVSLKLAQFGFMKAINAIQPILLLDDIFDKFDFSRVKQIINLVADSGFGQIFITHTNKERMLELFNEFNGNFNVFEVDNSNINLIE